MLKLSKMKLNVVDFTRVERFSSCVISSYCLPYPFLPLPRLSSSRLVSTFFIALTSSHHILFLFVLSRRAVRKYTENDIQRMCSDELLRGSAVMSRESKGRTAPHHTLLLSTSL
jgi:hypothetical protein